MLSNYKKIKEALLRGEIVVTCRRNGKTRALVEILSEDSEAVIITSNQKMIDLIIKPTWKIISDKPFPKKRVLAGKPGLKIDPKKKVFIDEYFFTNYMGQFFAATGTAPKPVTLIYPSKEFVELIMKDFKHLSPEVLKSEFMVDV